MVGQLAVSILGLGWGRALAVEPPHRLIAPVLAPNELHAFSSEPPKPGSPSKAGSSSEARDGRWRRATACARGLGECNRPRIPRPPCGEEVRESSSSQSMMEMGEVAEIGHAWSLRKWRRRRWCARGNAPACRCGRCWQGRAASPKVPRSVACTGPWWRSRA